MTESLIDGIERNPFYVLAVPIECSRQEFEREGSKLLSMLALDLAEARTYLTPLGTRPRTSELVRLAMAELRDPARRLVHELLATLPPSIVAEKLRVESRIEDPWREAPAFFGFGPPREPEQ